MKTILSILLFASILLLGACKKEKFELDIDIDIRDPEISNLDGGSKKLDFTIVVTQLGNYYHKDFHFKLKKFGGNVALDSFSTILPTAREFVKHTVVVASGGDYWIEASIGTEQNGASSGTLIKVPE